MKTRLIICALSATMALVSCTKERIKGDGVITTETRSITGFTAISASGSNNVTVNQGATFSVIVKGFSNLFPYFETKLVNNTLQVGYKQDVHVKNDNIEVIITIPVLTGLSLAGSGHITTTGVFNGITDFTASVAGSGNINFSSGTTQHFTSYIAGSGNIYAINLVADNADTEIAGSGNTEITAGSQLNVKIVGSGNVYYRGTPIITTSISGSGAVIPR